MGDLQAQRPELNYKDNSFNLFLPLRVYFYECSTALNTESSSKNPLYIYAEMAAKNARGMSVLPRRGLFERQKNFTAINTTTLRLTSQVIIKLKFVSSVQNTESFGKNRIFIFVGMDVLFVAGVSV